LPGLRVLLSFRNEVFTAESGFRLDDNGVLAAGLCELRVNSLGVEVNIEAIDYPMGGQFERGRHKHLRTSAHDNYVAA
jgi:hypothetical protein